MKILLTGGSGFVGSHMLPKLVEKGHSVVLLLRSPEKWRPPETLESKENVRPIEGDILDRESLKRAFAEEEIEAVIQLVGIIREQGEQTFEKVHFEGAKNIMEEAGAAGVKRFLNMSAEGVRAKAKSRYHKTKYKAEEHLRGSGLEYTIFRPSMMFGHDDKNFTVLAEMVRKAPGVIPVIGDGEYTWRPVWVDDVGECFARAVDMEESKGRTYAVPGPEEFSFNRILEMIMETVGVRKKLLHVPSALAAPGVAIGEKLLKNPPITTDQMTMLLEETPAVTDPNALEEFGITPRRFSEAIKKILAASEG